MSTGLRRAFARVLPHLSRLGPMLARHRKALILGYLCVLATNGFALAIPKVLGAGINRIVAGHAAGLITHAVWLVGLALASGVFRYLMRIYMISTSRRIEYELRNDFFTHLQTLSLSFFNRQRTGDLMARASNDLNAVRDVLGPGIMYAMNTVTTVVASAVLMIQIDARLTLYTLVPLPILAVLVRSFASEIHRRSRAVQDQYGVLSAEIQESVSGIRVVQSYVQERFEEEHFDSENSRYRDLGFRLIRRQSFFFGTMAGMIELLMLVLLWAGGIRVIQGGVDYGDFVAFLSYLGMLAWPFIAMGWVLSMVQRGEAAAARIFEVRDARPEIASPPAPVGEPPIRRGEIRFEQVGFRYAEEGPDVLRGIDVTIEAGTTVAIVGRTGSGKTSLVSLIPRLYDASEGAILVDSVDVRDRSLEALRAGVAVVPQESFLFSDTLRANLTFGNPDATEEQVARMVGLARLESDIETFPDGLETVVGERGITLSGGQRQRVALARALLTDPKILILDDAFSSLDKITERELLKGLKTHTSRLTTLLIAHRISTVRHADSILVLENGRIAESGTHDELLALRGLYAGLARRQQLADEIEDAPVA